MKQLVLFDIDGTLMNADGAGRAALATAMLEVYGDTGSIEDLDFHGKTDPWIVRELLRMTGRSDAVIDAGFDRLWALYCSGLERELDERQGRIQTYPGVRELLGRLQRDPRFVLALVTGNVEGGAWRKLRACRLADPFRFGAFGSDSEARDDLPPLAMQRAEAETGHRFDPCEVTVVGDTPADVKCARSSGTRALAVATGDFSKTQFSNLDPDYVFAQLSDVEAVVAAIAA
jgi:phosphoglycolate phosphatase-like HAD superfamily hydrolase